MAYRKKEFVRPDYKHDAVVGQACIHSNGEKIRLGAWDGQGVPPTKVLEKYLHACIMLKEQFEAERLGIQLDVEDRADITPVSEAVSRYMRFLDTSYKGYRRPDGTRSKHFERTRIALTPLVALFGGTRIDRFTTLELEAVQAAMCDHGTWYTGPKKKMPQRWCRKGVNSQIAKIKLMFRWMEHQRLVPEGRWHHIKSLPGLRVGRCSAPEAPVRVRLIADREVQLATRYCSPQTAAMILLARLSGMRPSEVCLMRQSPPGKPDRGINVSGDIWTYRPEEHKMEYMEQDRTIFLGPAEQDILEPFMDRANDNYLFQPRESVAWWDAHRSTLRQPRTTPVYPAEVRRVAAKKKQAAARKHLRQYNPHYTRDGFRQAIARALCKAKKFGETVSHWTPYDLRHTRLTEISQEFGPRASQAVAGHVNMKTTEVYLHELHELAQEVAMQHAGFSV